MEEKFNIDFLDEAIDFMNSLKIKPRKKIYYNLRKSQIINDPELFKKLTDNIWEFRTLFEKKQYRLFAFWDKSNKVETIVIATHGIIKKTNKTPRKEISKAITLREKYFKEKKQQL